MLLLRKAIYKIDFVKLFKQQFNYADISQILSQPALIGKNYRRSLIFERQRI